MGKTSKSASLINLFNAAKAEIVEIDERNTEEIVIGFVGPVGSGVTYTASIFSEILREQFKYSGEYIKISEIISASAVILEEEPIASNDDERISKLQNLGNKLRDTFGSTYLIEKTVSKINMSRGKAGAIPKARRHFTIIDSIKNPDEIRRLRQVYDETFWLIAVFAPDDVRKNRLRDLNLSNSYLAEIMERDQDEGLSHGQKVQDAMLSADFFIRNDKENDLALRRTVERFLDIIFGFGIQTPTKDESAMYAATSEASRSACLSRQVGAVILDQNGELIGKGNNDVPKFGGGLYAVEDTEGDHRCYRWKSKTCHNDQKKSEILNNVLTKFRAERVVDRKREESVVNILKNSELKGLIEFSRAVHAEMEAIISVARSGKGGIVNSTLYSTTFPCHSCARHIVAAGIKKVIYIEPYTKSLAIKLHDDAISTSEADEEKKVVFLQYEGVAPKNMIRLFKDRGIRKHAGGVLLTQRAQAKPVSLAPLDGFETREQMIVARVDKIEKARSLGGERV